MAADSPDLVIAKRLLDHAKAQGFQFQRVAEGPDAPLLEIRRTGRTPCYGRRVECAQRRIDLGTAMIRWPRSECVGNHVPVGRAVRRALRRPGPYVYDPRRQIAVDPTGHPLGPCLKKEWTSIAGTHTDGNGGDNETYGWEEVAE